MIFEVLIFCCMLDLDVQFWEDDFVMSDNIYGILWEDVFCCDFIVNGFFYWIGDCSVVDYVGGFEDFDKRIICVIGELEFCFCEDLVCMMCVCEFVGCLDFGIEVKIVDVIQVNVEEICKVLFVCMIEEFVQLFVSGLCVVVFDWMFEFELFDEFFLEVCDVIQDVDLGQGFFGLFDVIDCVDVDNLLYDVMLVVILVFGIVNWWVVFELCGYVKCKCFDLIVECVIVDLLQCFVFFNVWCYCFFEILMIFQCFCELMFEGNVVECLVLCYVFVDVCDFFVLVVDVMEGGEEVFEEWQELCCFMVKLCSCVRLLWLCK